MSTSRCVLGCAALAALTIVAGCADRGGSGRAARRVPTVAGYDTTTGGGSATTSPAAPSAPSSTAPAPSSPARVEDWAELRRHGRDVDLLGASGARYTVANPAVLATVADGATLWFEGRLLQPNPPLVEVLAYRLGNPRPSVGTGVAGAGGGTSTTGARPAPSRGSPAPRAASATTASVATTGSATTAPPTRGASAPPAWASRHGMDARRYQQEIDRLAALGFRPVSVTVHGSAAHPIYTGIWIRDGKRWAARHGLDARAYQNEVDRLARQGYRLRSVAVVGVWPRERYTATWVRDGLPWRARHRMTRSGYQREVDRLGSQGYRPVCVAVTGPLGSERYAAIWVRDGKGWAAAHARSWINMRRELERKAAADFQLISFAEYGTPGARNYAAIWEKGRAEAGHNMVFAKIGPARYQAISTQLASSGFRPACAVRVGTRSNPRYVCAWRLDGQERMRIRGAAVAELASLDAVMRDYMQDRRVRCASLAVVKNGRLVFARGYTYGPLSMRATEPTSRFRLASISKPITALAILRLVDQGALSLSTRLGDVLPAARSALDPRVKSITIEQLLRHQGGWAIRNKRDDRGRLVYRGLGFDPMFHDRVIAALTPGGLPIDSEDVIRFMFRWKRLQFAPGTQTAYSNFGFNVLGRVIEQVSGQRYERFVREQILAPLGLDSFRVGDARLSQRLPGEVIYLDAADKLSRDVHGSGALLPNQYGGWNLANMDSHGGWVASAVDLARLGDAAIRGRIVSAASTDWYVNSRRYPTHNGSLPGTWTWLRVRGDVVYAVLTNQRAVSGDRTAWSRRGEGIARRLDRAIDAISRWP